jgi:hypothetical protein
MSDSMGTPGGPSDRRLGATIEVELSMNIAAHVMSSNKLE